MPVFLVMYLQAQQPCHIFDALDPPVICAIKVHRNYMHTFGRTYTTAMFTKDLANAQFNKTKKHRKCNDM